LRNPIILEFTPGKRNLVLRIDDIGQACLECKILLESRIEEGRTPLTLQVQETPYVGEISLKL